MPLDDYGAGYSPDYPEKQACLRQYGGATLGIAGEVACRQDASWAYHGLVIIDVNAGSGWRDGIPGSPLILLDLALQRQAPEHVHAFFFEKNRNSCQALEARLHAAGYPPQTWQVICGDTHVTVPQFLATPGALPAGKKCYGLVYADPNGMFQFPPLKALSEDPRLRFVDFLLRPSTRQYKRVDNLSPNGHSPIRQRNTNLNDELLLLRKTQYAFGVPAATTWEHTWILATNLRLLTERLGDQLAPRGTPVGDHRWEQTVFSRNQIQQHQQLPLEFTPPPGGDDAAPGH